MIKKIKFLLGTGFCLGISSCFSIGDFNFSGEELIVDTPFLPEEVVIYINNESAQSLYEQGMKFKKQEGPIFSDDPEKSLFISNSIFNYIVNKYYKKDQMDDQTKEIVGKAIYEISKYKFKKEKTDLCFKGFNTARCLGIDKADKYLKRDHPNNNFYIKASLREYLSKDKPLSDIYELGKAFKKKEGPIFRENKEKSNHAALVCFYHFVDKYMKDKTQLDDKNEFIVNEITYEFTKNSFKKGENIIDCFLNFLYVRTKGISKAEKYLEKIRQENRFDLDSYLNEDHPIQEVLYLGISFFKNEGPIFVGEKNKSDICGIKCILHIGNKYGDIACAGLGTISLNISDYFNKIIKDYDSDYEYYSRGVSSGLEGAQENLDLLKSRKLLEQDIDCKNIIEVCEEIKSYEIPQIYEKGMQIKDTSAKVGLIYFRYIVASCMIMIDGDLNKVSHLDASLKEILANSYCELGVIDFHENNLDYAKAQLDTAMQLGSQKAQEFLLSSEWLNKNL